MLKKANKVFARALIAAVGLFFFTATAVPTLSMMGPLPRFHFIDTKGNVVIPSRFNSAGQFKDGQAPVSIWDYSGLLFIDQKGQLSIRRKPIDGLVYREKSAPNAKDQITGFFVGSQGKIALPMAPYTCARQFSEGLSFLSASRGDESWAFADRFGTIRLKSKGEHPTSEDPREDAQDFHEGLAQVRDFMESRRGYMDRTGAFVIAPRYRAAGAFSEGLARVSEEEEESPDHSRYRRLEEVSTDVSLYAQKMNYGFIDHQGAYVIACQFDDAGDFHEGLARVLVKHKWGFVDKSGKMVIQPQFDAANDFGEGLAAVYVRPKDEVYPNSNVMFWFIDKRGKRVITPEPRQTIESLGKFSDGLCAVGVSHSADETYPFDKELVLQLLKAIAQGWAGGFVSSADKAADRAQALNAIHIGDKGIPSQLRQAARAYHILDPAK